MHHPYEEIVQSALTEPGKVHERYSAFWHYSIGNQWLAMAQLGRAEPINTFPGWKALNRCVRKGQKAIELLMPVVVGPKKEDPEDDGGKKMIFIARKNWFGLSQTDGEPYVPPPTPGFSIEKAERELNITVEPFQHSDGNCQGYAITDKRVIAISPVAYDGLKTSFHECAHVLLHPNTRSADTPMLARDVKEVEAELTSYLVKSALGKTENLEYSRGYIRNWTHDGTVEKVRFGKVFGAVDAILKAGKIEPDRPLDAAAGEQPREPIIV